MADEQERAADDEKLDEMEEQLEDLDVPAEESENLKGGELRRAPQE
jgi:hypothetical protein